MNQSKFNSLICLRCVEEFPLEFNARADFLVCKKCSSAVPVRDGKAFYTHPPENAAINLIEDPTNQSRWSLLRRAQYLFLSSELSAQSDSEIICDLGAGPGQFQKLLQRFQVLVSVDFFPYPGVEIVSNLEERLPFRKENFDIIIAMNTLEHIPDTDRLLSECRRILKKRGVFIGSTPFLLGIHQAPYDFHRFTEFELTRLLDEAGFVDIEVVPLGTALDWYKTSQSHFFMKLFDVVRSMRQPIIRLPLYFLVKVLWNLEKIGAFVFAPLYRLNRDTAHTLGYGFVAKNL